MSEKRPAESSTEEPPIKKHKQITPEMYEKLEAKIAELEKRDTEAQKMTQEMIEKLQDRTAVSEEKFEKVKKLISKLNQHKKDLEMWIRFEKLLSDNYRLNSYRHPLLKQEFKNKITIAEENCKSVQDEINQLMD